MRVRWRSLIPAQSSRDRRRRHLHHSRALPRRGYTVTTLNLTDRDALERCVEVTRASSAEQREQVDAMLKDRDWIEVASFCAYSCQWDALHPALWQWPPCWVDPDDLPIKSDPDGHGLIEAGRLLQRLLNAGLSQFEPDPREALAAAKKRRLAAAEGVPSE